jgi:hypothetical protein
MSKHNGRCGLRLNAPYDLAYCFGLNAGKRHPEWSEVRVTDEANNSAYRALFDTRMRQTTKIRYYRELRDCWLVGFHESRNGVVMTVEEWEAQYGHPLEVYQRMKNGNSLDLGNCRTGADLLD